MPSMWSRHAVHRYVHLTVKVRASDESYVIHVQGCQSMFGLHVKSGLKVKVRIKAKVRIAGQGLNCRSNSG